MSRNPFYLVSYTLAGKAPAWTSCFGEYPIDTEMSYPPWN